MPKPKAYKALILDLDGTCVKMGLENMPSEGVVRAVKSLIQRGVPVSIATGRNVSQAKEPIKRLGIVELCMTTNGSVIYDPVKDQVLEIVPLQHDALDQIYTLAHEYLDRFIISTALDESRYDEELYKQGKITSVFIEKLTKEQAHEMAQKLKVISTISVHASNLGFDGTFYFVSITDVRATKQRALQHVLERLQIAAEDIVAVGDGDNDLPMIIAAGMGVSMGNGGEGLKAVADYLAPSVDEDGVAHVIDKFFPEG